MTTLPVIAIDGPAASGKGTLARRIAQALGFAHLDTGTLYRAVGLAVLKRNEDPADAEAATRAVQALDLSLLEDPALRSAETGVAASKVGAIPAVREALLAFQRNFAANPPCAFSDYGTCPLPPAGNTLTSAVRAGERNPRQKG